MSSQSTNCVNVPINYKIKCQYPQGQQKNKNGHNIFKKDKNILINLKRKKKLKLKLKKLASHPFCPNRILESDFVEYNEVAIFFFLIYNNTIFYFMGKLHVPPNMVGTF